jgi:hypothetical protein
VTTADAGPEAGDCVTRLGGSLALPESLAPPEMPTYIDLINNVK